MFKFKRFCSAFLGMYSLFFLIFCLAFDTASAYHFNPAQDNLSQVRADLDRYVDSHQYQRDLKKAGLRAKQLLTQAIQKNAARSTPSRLALVFDIDETILSNYKMMRQYAYGGNQVLFDQIAARADASLIQPIGRVYQQALDHHVAVFFVTGRPGILRAATIKNLHRVGLSHWHGIFLWSRHSKQTVSQFKTAVRAEIVKQGYRIILNVGDQKSDLVGGYAQARVKLPNPFYLIPSNHRH